MSISGERKECPGDPTSRGGAPSGEVGLGAKVGILGVKAREREDRQALSMTELPWALPVRLAGTKLEPRSLDFVTSASLCCRGFRGLTGAKAQLESTQGAVARGEEWSLSVCLCVQDLGVQRGEGCAGQPCKWGGLELTWRGG